VGEGRDEVDLQSHPLASKKIATKSRNYKKTAKVPLLSGACGLPHLDRPVIFKTS
jgi:hypothetical protein